MTQHVQQQAELKEIETQLAAMQSGELDVSEVDLPAWLAKLERANAIADGLETRVDSLLSELDTVLEGLEADVKESQQSQKPDSLPVKESKQEGEQ